MKICGLTSPEDARTAAAAGADAIGMVCAAAGARRRIDAPQACKIIEALPPFVTPVLLFADADAEQIESFCAQVGPATLQFHGRESAEFCRSFKRPYIKAIALQSPDDWAVAERDHPDASALLVDSGSGGSGRAFDWSLLPGRDRRGREVIVAGGLSAANVADAIAATDPYGVDVSSGVCRSGDPRRKDAALIADFVAAARRASA